jgi:hypothetical protein
VGGGKRSGLTNGVGILAYFTRPSRTINHGRIKEIRDGTKHRAITAASAEQLRDYIAAWPHIDPATGLHYIGDELLLKAREAMLQAVQGCCQSNDNSSPGGRIKPKSERVLGQD